MVNVDSFYVARQMKSPRDCYDSFIGRIRTATLTF